MLILFKKKTGKISRGNASEPLTNHKAHDKLKVVLLVCNAAGFVDGPHDFHRGRHQSQIVVDMQGGGIWRLGGDGKQ